MSDFHEILEVAPIIGDGFNLAAAIINAFIAFLLRRRQPSSNVEDETDRTNT